MRESVDSQSIIASMVEDYVNSNDLAYGAYNFKLAKPEIFDEIPVQEEYQDQAELIKSIKSDEFIVRSKKLFSHRLSTQLSKVSTLNGSINED